MVIQAWVGISTSDASHLESGEKLRQQDWAACLLPHTARLRNAPLFGMGAATVLYAFALALNAGRDPNALGVSAGLGVRCCSLAEGANRVMASLLDSICAGDELVYVDSVSRQRLV